MKFKKILLHFTGLRSLFMGYMNSVLGVVKAIFVIIAALVAFSFISKGAAGVVDYVKSIDYQTVLILIVTLIAVFTFFSLISITLINFFASVRYCKEKSMKLSEFYSLSDEEILKLWDYKK